MQKQTNVFTPFLILLYLFALPVRERERERRRRGGGGGGRKGDWNWVVLAGVKTRWLKQFSSKYQKTNKS